MHGGISILVRHIAARARSGAHSIIGFSGIATRTFSKGDRVHATSFRVSTEPAPKPRVDLEYIGSTFALDSLTTALYWDRLTWALAPPVTLWHITTYGSSGGCEDQDLASLSALPPAVSSLFCPMPRRLTGPERG